MGHKNRASLRDQAQAALRAKLAIGEKRHEAKEAGTAQDKIFSWSTYRTYLKHSIYFVDWCKEHYRCRTLEQCRPHVAEWMETRRGLSPYTQKMELAALAKMYGVTVKSLSDWRKYGHGLGVETPSRSSKPIIRSRGTAARDVDFNELRHWQFVEFCRTTGLRRNELRELTGDALCQDDGGRWVLHITKGTKGGRPRYAPLVGTDAAIARVVERIQQAGKGRVWLKVPGGADIHSYRAEYAMAVYKANERPLEAIPRVRSEKGYVVRDVYRQRDGTVFDRQALRIASHALGHRRVDVIVGHYLRED